MPLNHKVDVTSIKVKVKFPVNRFLLYIMDYCPHSLILQLAFQYKLLQKNELEFKLEKVSPASAKTTKLFVSKTGTEMPPQVQIDFKKGRNQIWLSDSRQIINFLDANYTRGLLLLEEKGPLNIQVSQYSEWLLKSFEEIYKQLLFLNPNNLNLASNAWLQADNSLLNKVRLFIYKKETRFQQVGSQQTKEQAYKKTVISLENLLNQTSEQLENSVSEGKKFLFGSEISIADLTLYSFLYSILNLEEKGYVKEKSIFLEYIEKIDDLELNTAPVNKDKRYTNQRQTVINEPLKFN